MGRTGLQTSGLKKDYLARVLDLKAVRVRGIVYRLNDLLLAIGKHFPVEETVVKIKRQHLVEVSYAAFYRWRRELLGEGEDQKAIDFDAKLPGGHHLGRSLSAPPAVVDLMMGTRKGGCK